MADRFLAWLAVPPDSTWLEVGCGTGALTSRILTQALPRFVVACEPSSAFLEHARGALPDPRVTFVQADAKVIPPRPPGYDAVVSGLVLNFLPDPLRSVQAMVGATTVPATVAAYVWDYAGGMEFLRYFWDAALHLDPGATIADEGQRFPLCNPQALASLWSEAGLQRVRTTPLDVGTTFRDFEDYWAPLEGGQGPAPTYLMGLPSDTRVALRERVRSCLPFGHDGTIALRARAWAVAGMHGG